MDNAFARVDDPAALQEICDGLGDRQIQDLLDKWLQILPNPFTSADTDAGYRYDVSILQAEFSLTQMLDTPTSGRVFFENVIRENLDIGRPDQVSLIFDRQIKTRGPKATASRFRTRVITDWVTPSLHADYKSTTIKQYHKEGRALRTETTINNTYDFGVRKGLTNLPALRDIGFTANRRLLRVQTISHDPINGIDALHTVTDPVITPNGTRVPGLRLGQQRSHALLTALPMFKLQPHGFRNRDLRQFTAELRGVDPDSVTVGQMTYDLRRLRVHGLIQRLPRSSRYQVTTPDWPPRCSSTPSTTGYSRPAWPTSTATNPPPSEQLRSPTEPPSTTSPEQPDSPREPDPTIQDTTQESRLRRFSPLAQSLPHVVLHLGGRHEQQFIAGFQRFIGLRDDHPAAAQDGDQRRIAGQSQVADRPACDAGGLGQRDLDEVDLALAQGEQPDQVADRHRLLDQGGQDARRRHGDVHPPGVGEQPFVARIVDPADHPADREFGLGQQRHHQVHLVVARAGDHHVAGLQSGVLQQRDLAGIGKHPFRSLDALGLDRLGVPVDEHDLVAIFDKLPGDGTTHRPGSRNSDSHRRCSLGQSPGTSAAMERRTEPAPAAPIAAILITDRPRARSRPCRRRRVRPWTAPMRR